MSRNSPEMWPDVLPFKPDILPSVPFLSPPFRASVPLTLLHRLAPSTAERRGGRACGKLEAAASRPAAADVPLATLHAKLS